MFGLPDITVLSMGVVIGAIILLFLYGGGLFSLTNVYSDSIVPALFLRKNQFRYTIGVMIVVSRLMSTSTT
jgi:hypothetical protein